jgi:hypothetical protein
MLTTYLTIAKWGGIVIVVLGLFAGIGTVILRVNSWHQDSKALPAVTAARDTAITERDAARKAKAAAEEKFVGTLDGIAGKIATLQTRMADLQSQIDRDRASRADALNHFLETTAHVSNDASLGSDGDLVVRRGLLDLLRNPDTGQLGRGDGGNGAGGNSVGVPNAAARPDAVPGRSAPGDNAERGAVVPAAGGARYPRAKRTAERCHRRRAAVGAGRTKRKAAAGRAGSTVPSFFDFGHLRCRCVPLIDVSIKAHANHHG